MIAGDVHFTFYWFGSYDLLFHAAANKSLKILSLVRMPRRTTFGDFESVLNS